MSEWNISGDGMTIEQSKRRSPMRWLRDNSLKLAIVIGLSEAAVAYFKGFHFLWAIGLLAVFGYWWIRNRVPQSAPDRTAAPSVRRRFRNGGLRGGGRPARGSPAQQ